MQSGARLYLPRNLAREIESSAILNLGDETHTRAQSERGIPDQNQYHIHISLVPHLGVESRGLRSKGKEPGTPHTR